MRRARDVASSATDVRRGDPNRAASMSVIRMGSSAVGTHRGEGQEGVPQSHSKAEQQLQELLSKQLDVTKDGFERREKKEFTAGVIFEPLMTKGAHSLTEYTRLQDSQTQLEELRHLGLTNEEIALLLGQEDTWPHLGTGAAPHLRKRPKQEADSGLGADPVAQRQRITAIEHKLKEKQEEDERSLSTESRGVALVSRHAMEVEVSARRAGAVESSHGSEDLSHLVLQKERNNWNFPKEIMPSHTPYKVERMLQDRGKRRSELQTSPNLNTGVEGDEGACSPDAPPQLASIEPLPVQVIERNRLSLEEIRKLPRFGDYAPGLPSKVLFVKNLHHKVSEKDLFALFGQFQGDGEDPVLIRLMKGKMKGQAFVEFHTVEQAEAAMKLVNGYMMRRRPVIIQFGKRKD